MREVVLNIQTTGLDWQDGHRIVEIGLIELIDHIPSGRSFHQYIQPERMFPAEAFETHGLDDAFLADKPIFADIAQSINDFVGDAKLVTHIVEFNGTFLNKELSWANLPVLDSNRFVDTSVLSKTKFPEEISSVDALCRRYNIDVANSRQRDALSYSEVLAEIYYNLGDFRKTREALFEQVSLVLRNSTAVSISAKDTANNLRSTIAIYLNKTRSNELSDELEVFQNLADYFDRLSVELDDRPSRKELEKRVQDLELIVQGLVNKVSSKEVTSSRKLFVEAFVKTCGSTAAVAMISTGTLVIGRYAPSVLDSFISFVTKP